MRAHFRSRLEQAYSQGFRLLRRIPSTSVWRTLGYVCSLPEAERIPVINTCANIAHDGVMASWGFRPQRLPPIGPGAEQTPQSLLFNQIYSQSYWSECPDRFLRQFGATADALSGMVDESRIPSIMALDPPEIAKAGAIRKVLHRRIKEEFAAELLNCGGGEWRCTGNIDATKVCISLDYGGMGPGFRYGVGFSRSNSPDRLTGGVTLESSYGFPASQNWDFPLTDELDELADTMCEVVINLSRLHGELMAHEV